MTQAYARAVALSHPSASLTLGLAALATELYRGADPAPFGRTLLDRIAADSSDAGALMDLSYLLQLTGHREDGLACQAQALRLQQIYELPPSHMRRPYLRLLMFATPGDFMSNTPVEFLIDGSAVSLTTVYLLPDRPFPETLPDHDIALVGIAEASHTQGQLLALGARLAVWPKPILNMPARIPELARERLFEVIGGCPGVEIPVSARVSREWLADLAAGRERLRTYLPDADFPIIARPAGTHAGNGLVRLETREEIATLLEASPEAEFTISRFVDYRSADGRYRKYRVACINGRSYLCHLAISDHWMIHYLNAGMHEDAGKRLEEAEAMRSFDATFGKRHAGALAAVQDTLGLDYVALDCAETREGKLLVFEAGTAMIVHGMDPPDLFPYKQVQMQAVKTAFVEMLATRACASAVRAST